MFYGDRSAGVVDPLGNHWWIHTRVEDVSEEEMMQRAREQQGSYPWLGRRRHAASGPQVGSVAHLPMV